MTVHELVQRLRKLPQNTTVAIWDSAKNTFSDVADVELREICFASNDRSWLPVEIVETADQDYSKKVVEIQFDDQLPTPVAANQRTQTK